MAKTLVRTDDLKAELWFRCTDLQETPTAPDTKYEWRSLHQPSPFEDDGAGNETLLHDAAGVLYSDPGRRLTDGTAGTDDELGAGVAGDGSMLALFNKAVAEADSRESVGAGERIPDFELRLWIEWLSNTTYKVTVRIFSYGQKRNDPENGQCFEYSGAAPGTFKAGYELVAADLGLEATVGDVAWFVKTKVLDPIKTAEGIP